MAIYDPQQVAAAQTSARFSVLARTDLDPLTIGTWDSDLLREPRVLVPVDVQALVVAPGSTEAAVPLPGPLSPGATPDATSIDGPAPFSAGSARAPGVHLSWALPDALLRGRLQDPTDKAGGGLDLPVLPDRWAVLRLTAAAEAVGPGNPPVAVRGWLIDAAAAVVRDLESGPTGTPLPLDPARALTPQELTGAAGGTLTWTGAYDAAFGRFAWHDPLDDLAADATLGGRLPGGPVAGSATYLVVGWWSLPELDPLDGVRTEGGLAERTQSLGWRLVAGGGAEHTERIGALQRLSDLGVPVATRLDPAAAGSAFVRAQAPVAGGGVAGQRFSAATILSDSLSSGGFARASLASTTAAYQAIGATSLAREAGSWLTGTGVGVEASTLLHGAVIGVPLPVAGGSAALDLRPAPEAVTVVAGEHVDDLVAAGLSAAVSGDSDARRGVERLLVAFSTGLLSQLSSPDGMAEIDDREHSAGFATVDPVELPLVDRVLTGRATVPPRGAPPQASAEPAPTGLTFAALPERAFGFLTTESPSTTRARLGAMSAAASPALSVSPTLAARARAGPVGGVVPPGLGSGNPGSGSAGPGEDTVLRPAPRRYQPVDPMVALRGAGRSLRHGGDGRADPDERLSCRRASQVAQRYTGVLDGAALLPTLSSGALPVETLGLAREALLLSPYLLGWMAQHASSGPAPIPAAAATARLGTELALRYDPGGGYLGKAAAGATVARGDLDGVRSSTVELLRRHSLLEGVEPDLVALTSWAQPWIPMWLEWQLDVTPLDDLSGWQLGAVDLEPDTADGTPPPAQAPVTVAGRSPVSTAPGTQLSGAITGWLTQEGARDRDDQGEVDEDTANRLAGLAAKAAQLDLLATSLDGVRSALLGLPVSSLRPRGADGTLALPTPTGLPRLLHGGTVTPTRLRLVDAFGRTLDLDPKAAVVPERVALPARPGAMLRTPRLAAPARCRVRLVGADAVDARTAVDAVVDEVDASRQVSPVIGFLLPNHVDESVQVFGADGAPLGELLTEPTGGGVVWEPAPGRPLRADASPGEGLTAAQRPLGMLASGMVAADVTARAGRSAQAAGAPAESAVSAFLRAIDTTLWTVDPISGAGSSAVASIVGRPVAVVRTTVTLEVADDLATLALDDSGRAARAAAYDALTRLQVGVRIGELTRTDDGVLGWFVDDDFTRVHVVDAAVRDLAREAGRNTGHFGPWGTTPVVPDLAPIEHPYLDVDRDLLLLQPGVPRLVTLLMLPGSSATLTCGILPRVTVRLFRAWFAPGLEKLSPSVRVGPVLNDPGDVRLPMVSALGDRQVFSHREGPLAWKDDAILAATQAALLPDRASVLREGWVRVDPAPPPPPGPGAGATGPGGGG